MAKKAKEAGSTTKADAVLDGIAPKAGMWLVSHQRHKAYGQIVKVRSDGTVVWSPGDVAANVETAPVTLNSGTYAYADAVPEGYAAPNAPAKAVAFVETSLAEVAKAKEEPVPTDTETKVRRKAKAPAADGRVELDTKVLRGPVLRFVKAHPKSTCPQVVAALVEGAGGESLEPWRGADPGTRFRSVRKVMRGMAKEGELSRRKSKGPTGRDAYVYAAKEE